MTTTQAAIRPSTTLAEQAPLLLTHVAGYVAHRTAAIGLRSGLIRALADPEGNAVGCTVHQLAARLRLDPFPVGVWCRAALAARLCEVATEAPTDGSPADGTADPRTTLSGRASGTAWPDDTTVYRLAPHIATLLTDRDHPAYLGGVVLALEQPEVFDRFESSLVTGNRMWWNDCRPEWIDSVADTGAPFYRRLIPSGLERIPGLTGLLRTGCRVLDSACGAGGGLIALAREYPRCEITGVGGDQQSLDRAQRNLGEAGLAGSVRLVHSALEDLTADEPIAVVINNISMHECRDIDGAIDRIRALLDSDGYFVISDFPFPDTVEALQSVPGRVMSGIQFFEAQIDDQLQPRAVYPALLQRKGFRDVDQFDISPVHTVTFGRK